MSLKGILAFLETKMLRRDLAEKLDKRSKDNLVIAKDIPQIAFEVPGREGNAPRILMNANASNDFGFNVGYPDFEVIFDPAEREIFLEKTAGSVHEILNKGNTAAPGWQTRDEVACWYAYMSTDYTLIDDMAWRKIPFNAIIRDPQGKWSAADSEYVIPNTGLYWVRAGARWSSATQGSYFGGRIMTRTGNVALLWEDRRYYYNAYAFNGSALLWLGAGERLRVEVYSEGTTGVLTGNNVNTFFQGVQLN
jgi:hypothetical protein